MGRTNRRCISISKKVGIKSGLYKEEDSLSLNTLKVFGADIFEEEFLNFEPNLKLATPVNYVLGPGDELQISVYGIQEFSPRIFSNACDTLQNNLKFILKALKLDENVFDYLSDSMKSNETIQQNINSVKLQKYLNEINSGNNPNSMDDDLPF